MNKKKLLTIAMVLSMAAILAIGGTIAYFTAEDYNTNTFAIGDVNIELDEAEVTFNDETNLWEVNDPENRVKENVYEEIYPGAVLPKDPTVHNVGTNEAYIRVTVTANPYALGHLMNDDAKDSKFNFESLVDINTDSWTFEEGSEKLENVLDPENATYSITYRYKWIVQTGADTTPLFTKVTIPTTLETMYNHGNWQFELHAEAIQSDTFADADAAWDAFEAQTNPQV